MILAKARQESRDFYEVLDYYLNLIRQLHIRTYAYLGEYEGFHESAWHIVKAVSLVDI